MVLRRSNRWIRNLTAVAGVAVIASTAGILSAAQPPAPLIDRRAPAKAPAAPAPLPPAPRQLPIEIQVEPPKPPAPQPLKSFAVVIERQAGSVQKTQRGQDAGAVRTALRKPDSLRLHPASPAETAPAAPKPKPLPALAKSTVTPSKATAAPVVEVARKPAGTATGPALQQGVAKLAPYRPFKLATLQPSPGAVPSQPTQTAPAPEAAKPQPAKVQPATPKQPPIILKQPSAVETAEEIPTSPIQPAPVNPAVREEAPIVQTPAMQPGIVVSPQQEYGVPGLTNAPPQTGVAIFGDDFKPIGQVSAVIKPAAGDLPTDFAGPKFAVAGEMMHLPGETRPWALQCFHWTAPNSNHKPLYFEDVNLERHGYTYGRLLQPYLSGAKFFSTFAILPYKMALDGPCQNIYTLGHYRPGSCAPYERYTVPFELYPTLVEAGAITALFVIFP